jgi:hypothetical protein
LTVPYLNPDNGRFLTMDSFRGNSEDPQSLHKYLYCHGDPVNAHDPSGNNTVTELVFTQSIRNILQNVVTGGVINATLGALLNGETSWDQILYNFGTGGLLSLAGNGTSSLLKGVTTNLAKRFGFQLVAKLLYIAGVASLNAFYHTVAIAAQEKYVNHRNMTFDEFKTLYIYNLAVNLVASSLVEALEGFAEKALEEITQVRNYQRLNGGLPNGWAQKTLEERQQMSQLLEQIGNLSEKGTINSILLNVAEEFGKMFGAEEAKHKIFEESEADEHNHN